MSLVTEFQVFGALFLACWVVLAGWNLVRAHRAGLLQLRGENLKALQSAIANAGVEPARDRSEYLLRLVLGSVVMAAWRAVPWAIFGWIVSVVLELVFGPAF